MNAAKQPRKGPFIARWSAIIGLIAVAAIVLNIFALGTFKTVLDGYFRPSLDRSDAVTQASKDLTEEIQSEGIVLLKNNGVLPLAEANQRVNVFGWSATSPVFGGTGSGAVDASTAVSFLGGLEASGIEYNTEITDFYTQYRTDRPVIAIRAQDWTVPEPSMDEYDAAGIFESAEAFSDTAVVMLSRSGGEGADIAMSLSGQAGDIEMQTLPDGREVSVGVAGSEYADDVDAAKHYLELSNREQAMLERVSSEFENVVVVLNTGNTFELGWIDELDVDAVTWIGGPGETGFNAVAGVLTGDVNPSGRTVDTWLYDLLGHPAVGNFGAFNYLDSENVDTGDVSISFSGDPATSPGFQFLNYAEGIYVGYKYFESVYEGDETAYDATVQFPFGYGLSYSSFEQEMGDLVADDDSVTIDVTVTNTGSTAGKDVVQLYSNPPYTEGGIEKASVNLVAFDKTAMLEPGASETLTLSVDLEDLAAFDVDGVGAYVLESGTYELSLRENAHAVIDAAEFDLDEDVVYAGDNARSTDLVTAEALFSDSLGEVTVLSRAGDFANAQEALEPAVSREMTAVEEAAVNITLPSGGDSAPTTGASGSLTLADMAGLDYDDPQWDALLDQVTEAEMSELISLGGYQTKPVRSIDKPATIDIDGPQGLSSFLGASVSAGAYPTAMVLASTWNADLAHQRGQMVGYEALELGVSGWYAPGMNMHRSPFGGRNFEYYSEDALISAAMAAGETSGAQEQGLYVYIKHFVANDQEKYRNSRLVTWVDEQTLREIYMKPFEAAVKDGGATAVMSAYNYIGGVWAGGDSRLLNSVLRDEWGFQGMVITDYFGDYGYMNADWAIANGGDMMLSTLGMFGASATNTDDASQVNFMRTATHNILFTVANSNAMFTDAERLEMLAPIGGEINELGAFTMFANGLDLEPWNLILYIGNVVLGLLLVTLAVFKVRKYHALFPRQEGAA
ncbi:MAG: glycoside hydrolase family 3 C-terminal domain-containing protein [Ruaniaceae bacterium]|nr:glycoside hydrolase family 3 C-terminal domain-containing protein [Ruaniaceae bacterium]